MSAKKVIPVGTEFTRWIVLGPGVPVPGRRSQSTSVVEARCGNPKNSHYPDYGGRGIKVCDRWMDFQNFLEDMGRRPPGKSIDRLNNNGNYEKSNCAWRTLIEQGNNRRNNIVLTIRGVTGTLAELCREFDLPYLTIRYRLKAGWPAERAFEHPVGKMAEWDRKPKTLTQPNLL